MVSRKYIIWVISIRVCGHAFTSSRKDFVDLRSTSGTHPSTPRSPSEFSGVSETEYCPTNQITQALAGGWRMLSTLRARKEMIDWGEWSEMSELLVDDFECV